MGKLLFHGRKTLENLMVKDLKTGDPRLPISPLCSREEAKRIRSKKEELGDAGTRDCRCDSGSPDLQAPGSQVTIS